MPSTAGGAASSSGGGSGSGASTCACTNTLHEGSYVLRCASLACANWYHYRCTGFTPSSAAHHWRCGSCRVRAMMPLADVISMGGGVRLLRAQRSGESSVTLRWSSALAGVSYAPSPTSSSSSSSAAAAAAATTVPARLVCMEGGNEAELDCLWPAHATLTVNGMAINVPRPPQGHRSAPLLDVTTLLRPARDGPNEVVVKIPHVGVVGSASFYAAAVEIRTLDRDGIMRGILRDRCLDVNFARLALVAQLELARRPGGTWCGIAGAGLSGVRPLWEATKGGRLGAAVAATPLRPASFLLSPSPAIAAAREAVSAAEAAGTEGTVKCAYGAIEEADVFVDSLSLSFRDAASFAPIAIPVRGDACGHAQCIDLSTYLRLNEGASAKWRCPVCKRPLMPSQLWVDTYALGLMRAIAAGTAGGEGAAGEALLQKTLLGTPGEGVGPFNIPLAGVPLSPAAASRGVEMLGEHEWRVKGGGAGGAAGAGAGAGAGAPLSSPTLSVSSGTGSGSGGAAGAARGGAGGGMGDDDFEDSDDDAPGPFVRRTQAPAVALEGAAATDPMPSPTLSVTSSTSSNALSSGSSVQIMPAASGAQAPAAAAGAAAAAPAPDAAVGSRRPVTLLVIDDSDDESSAQPASKRANYPPSVAAAAASSTGASGAPQRAPPTPLIILE
jgi:hypothetical protein